MNDPEEQADKNKSTSVSTAQHDDDVLLAQCKCVHFGALVCGESRINSIWGGCLFEWGGGGGIGSFWFRCTYDGHPCRHLANADEPFSISFFVLMVNA